MTPITPSLVGPIGQTHEACIEQGPRPSVGVLDFHPIQYHSPLYQHLADRRNIDLDVLYLDDHGLREAVDTGFGVSFAWNIDLLSGYSSNFLSATASVRSRTSIIRRWISLHDVIIIHGYSSPWMLFAMFACRIQGVPYLMRGDSKPAGEATGLRRRVRTICARTAVAGSAGGLAVGQLNEAFYHRFRARRVVFAPHSVDDVRFAAAPCIGRPELLARWKIDPNRPVVMFCGKLSARKRPLDLALALRLLAQDVTVLFVGDGPLRAQVLQSLRPGSGVVTGFVNQLELPSYYHAADVLVLPSAIEPWGLVVNEAMAAGTLPVVSDRVGAAPDLVSGVGEVYACGNIADLAGALRRGLARASDPGSRDQIRRRLSRYSIDQTVIGFERGAIEVSAGNS
jgi:glycosyltransferase involved in cell wall biosynthesis